MDKHQRRTGAVACELELDGRSRRSFQRSGQPKGRLGKHDDHHDQKELSHDEAHAADDDVSTETTHLVVSGAPRWVAAAFQCVAYMAAPTLLPPRPSGGPIIDDFLKVKPGDVALCVMVQPYGAETAKAAAFAKRRGARIVALTDSRASPLAPLADYFVRIPSTSPQFFPSLIALLTVLETLTALMVARCDKATSERIEEFDRLRRAEGVCWEPGRA